MICGINHDSVKTHPWNLGWAKCKRKKAAGYSYVGSSKILREHTRMFSTLYTKEPSYTS
jgi:hypothetical protein